MQKGRRGVCGVVASWVGGGLPREGDEEEEERIDGEDGVEF